MSNSSTGSRACEFCYARKIKCIMTEEKLCRACKENHIECRQRQTKRQGRPRGHSKHTFRAQTSGPNSETSSSNSSACNSRTDSAVSLPQEAMSPTSMHQFQQTDPMALFDLAGNLNLSSPWEQDAKLVYPSPPLSNPDPVAQIFDPSAQMFGMDLSQTNPFVADMGDLSDPDTAKVGSSLFNGYLEIDTMLKRISGGTLLLSLPDFGEQGAVIQQLSQVVDAATEGANSMFVTRDRSVMRLAILAVRKACDLADFGVAAVQSYQGSRRSSSIYGGSPPAMGSPMSTSPDFSRRSSSPEQIAAMLRVDDQLAKLKAAVGKYASCDQGLSSTENAAVIQSQHLLLQIHLRIKRAMDSMVPEWEH